jgi:PAS domain S-box-containing protein
VNNRDIPPANPLLGAENFRDRKAERHLQVSSRSRDDVLSQLPAEMLLDRLDTATIVIGLDGVVVYANPACERLLGYQMATTLGGQSLAALIIGQSDTPPQDCIELLRDRSTVTNWNHSDGYPVAARVSDSMLLRGTPLMMMVTLTDVSDRAAR